MTPEDSFYFWSFDHGGTENNPTDPNDVTLTAWANQSIQDDVFASWVNPFDVKAEIFAFGQCFAGGMVDDLTLSVKNNRFAAWAAEGCEPSYGQGWADAWADGIESGLRWSHELGQYALVNDPYGPNGLALEHPGWSGKNIHIVTNQIPEPSSVILTGLGLMLFLGVRRKG